MNKIFEIAPRSDSILMFVVVGESCTNMHIQNKPGSSPHLGFQSNIERQFGFGCRYSVKEGYVTVKDGLLTLQIKRNYYLVFQVEEGVGLFQISNTGLGLFQGSNEGLGFFQGSNEGVGVISGIKRGFGAISGIK